MVGSTTGRERVKHGSTPWKVGVLALLIPLAGCYKHTVHAGNGAPTAPVASEEWQHFWLGGLIGHTRIDVEQICPSGDATIHVRQTFLNGLVSGLTGGIYTPTTVLVRCHDGRRSELEVDADGLRSIAEDPAFLEWVATEHPALAEEVRQARADA